MIFHFSIVPVHFIFLLIEFHCTFYLTYKILSYHVYYYCFFDYVMTGRGDFFFFRASLTSFHTHPSHLTLFFCFFVLFHSCCSHAPVFWKTLVHEFHISYRLITILNDTSFLSDSAATRNQESFETRCPCKLIT